MSHSFVIELSNYFLYQPYMPPIEIFPVILSGGAGTRLWPLSREGNPKPFITLDDGQSLLQKTHTRALQLPGCREITTITHRDLFWKTQDSYAPLTHGARHRFLLEPFGRNTAPAIALASLTLAQAHGNDTIAFVMPADHIIADTPAFIDAAAQAAALARSQKIVTLGITPTRAETGYGYIEISGDTAVRFVEKPTADIAQKYMASGQHVWNAGIFCFEVGVMLAEYAAHAPDILEDAKRCLSSARTTHGENMTQLELSAEYFMPMRNVSVDYAIMEKSARVAVVRADMGWNDIGNFHALGDLTTPDAQGNRCRGEALLQDSEDCYIHSEHGLVAALGVRDLMIVNTADALLVADKSRAQDVRLLASRLKTQGHKNQLQSRQVHRPWGTYTVIETGQSFKIKRIVVKPGAALSLQMHKHRSEHWVVVSGKAQITRGQQVSQLCANQSAYIPVGQIHRLENPGAEELVMIEVQIGNVLSEDDIIRFNDIYARADAG